MTDPSQAGLTALPPSRLVSLLTNNDVPLDAEIPVICLIVAEKQARIDALSARLDDRGTGMKPLMAERDEVIADVRRYKAILSPIRRVPPELLCDIFAFTLPWTRMIKHPWPRNITERTVPCAPWRLGHICRLWRQSAHTDPFLWRTIDVLGYPGTGFLEVAHPLAGIETQLILSANTSLHVHLDLAHGTEGADNILRLLLPHSDRWSRILLKSDPSNDIFEVLQRAQNRVSQLREVGLFWEGLDSNHFLNSDTFSGAPSLCKVFLTDPDYEMCSAPLNIPWSQITHYRGVYSTKRQCQILAAAPNLLEGGICVEDNGEKGDTVSVITLLHLHRLYSEESNFLACLAAPSLQYLYAKGSSSSQELKVAVKALPSLQYLLFDVDTDINPDGDLVELFDAMKLTGSSDICPVLTTLAVGYAGFRGSETLASSLLPMVQSRLQPDPPSRPLSVLRLHAHPDLTVPMMNGIKDLADQGLDAAIVPYSTWIELVMLDRP
ncbi:hypothetical protein C8R43DRAFT_17760 [Mycena crocata]|nr:hypothetical protein C8R43DRAFT_17760 [Mycena crocata]